MAWHDFFHMKISVVGGNLGMRVLHFPAFASAFTILVAVFVAFSVKDFGYPLRSAR